MKKLELGQTISILANVGVIAGILFLAFEIHQNNTLLESQARKSRIDMRRGSFQLQLENPELNRIINQNRNSGQLTDEEQNLLNAFFDYILTSWQGGYGDYQSGLIELSEMQHVVSGLVFDRAPGLEEYWQTAKFRYEPEFAAWIDQILDERNSTR